MSDSPMPSAAMPILFVIDDDVNTLSALAEVLARRYGNDYRVISDTSIQSAIRTLEQCRADGEDVVLVIADLWMPEMTGIEFLSRVHELHPDALRVLLIESMDTTAFPPMLQATALGRIDQHVHKPWTPPDDQLHPTVTELLGEWTRRHRPRHELVRIVGDRWDPRCHELRDLLDRNNIAHGFYAADSSEGKAVLQSLGVAADRLPVVALYKGGVFVQPSNLELAQAFGVKTGAPAEDFDLAVIGAGPAGLAAAVYGASEGLKTVVLEREAIGGQAGTSSMIRNYLGFPRGVSGTDLAQRAYSQAWHFGAQFIFMQEATALRADGDIRIVKLSGGSEIRARTVILATGVSYRRLNVPSIDRLLGAGVFYGAAVTEAQAMEGQHVFVVGAANSAGQAAVHLADYARHVTIVARGSLAASMSAYLMTEIHRTKNITVLLNTEVIEGRGSSQLEGLLLRNSRTGKEEEVEAAALFILIGAAPHTDWLQHAVRRDDRGYIVTDADLSAVALGTPTWPLSRLPHLLETSMPGVFAVGDVRHGSVKRVAAAVGEGSMAIALVHAYLSEQRTLARAEQLQ